MQRRECVAAMSAMSEFFLNFTYAGSRNPFCNPNKQLILAAGFCSLSYLIFFFFPE